MFFFSAVWWEPHHDRMETGTGSSGCRQIGMQRDSKFDYPYISYLYTHTHALPDWGSSSDLVRENETGYIITQGFVQLLEMCRASQLCHCPTRTCVNSCSAESPHRAHLSQTMPAILSCQSNVQAIRLSCTFELHWPAHSIGMSKKYQSRLAETSCHPENTDPIVSSALPPTPSLAILCDPAC